MQDNLHVEEYVRKVSPPEQFFMRSPYAVVAMVARIKGTVSESALRHAVDQIRQRHTLLRVHIWEDSQHQPRFVSEGTGDIPIKIVPRVSGQHWMSVYHEVCRIPFEFESGPLIRIFLVQSRTESELLIFCHHIICDGLSLAYLMRDLLQHLGDPEREVEVLPDPAPVDLENLPDKVTLNPILKYFIRRMNKKWEKESVFFDQEDYLAIHEAYWANYQHQMLLVELSETDTTAIVERCRQEQVTVNSALTAAFVEAHIQVRGEQPYHASMGSASSLRDRLPIRPGEAMGFYAGMAALEYEFDAELGFWENARSLHKKLEPLYSDKTLFREPLMWCHLDPSMVSAKEFKVLGPLVSPDSPRYEKLSAFATRDDVVTSFLRRGKLDSLDDVIMGTAVTNSGRLDIPKRYGALELDRLIMNPGGGFPLVNINMVVGAVTCSGKLSLILEYAEQRIDTGTMDQIRDMGMALLLGYEL